MQTNGTSETRAAGRPPVSRGDEPYVDRVPRKLLRAAAGAAGVGVTDAFEQIVDEFAPPAGETPAGFRIEPVAEPDGGVRFDLVRDIGCDRNGGPRPTPRTILRNRRIEDEGADGLDHARQTLRWLRTANLPETRLILCSMEGLLAYPDIMRMLTEPEFVDMHHRVLITTEPNYLARWTSRPQVVSGAPTSASTARRSTWPAPRSRSCASTTS